jgi:hypothetical protein
VAQKEKGGRFALVCNGWQRSMEWVHENQDTLLQIAIDLADIELGLFAAEGGGALGCSTYKTPCRHCRSGTGRGPGDFAGQGGSSGSIDSHNSSSTIYALLIRDRTILIFTSWRFNNVCIVTNNDSAVVVEFTR